MVCWGPLSVIVRLPGVPRSMQPTLNLFAILLLIASPALAATQEVSTQTSSSVQASSSNPADLALQARLNALEAAKRSGNPDEIATASKALIALALRQVAGLRLLQSAFPDAAELYKRSLDFEELPDTHVDLAVVYMRARQPDNALTEAGKAVFSDSENARAWHVQGKTWMMKKDYRRATESL